MRTYVSVGRSGPRVGVAFSGRGISSGFVTGCACVFFVVVLACFAFNPKTMSENAQQLTVGCAIVAGLLLAAFLERRRQGRR